MRNAFCYKFSKSKKCISIKIRVFYIWLWYLPTILNLINHIFFQICKWLLIERVKNYNIQLLLELSALLFSNFKKTVTWLININGDI